jgi:hypothetical protein
MHQSVGRAASGVVDGPPATIVAALAPGASSAAELGSINLAVWASIAPAQAAAAWIGVRLAQRRSQPGYGHRAGDDRVHDASGKPMKPSMTGHWRSLAGRIDGFCGRCNDGSAAVAIVLAVIMLLAVGYRTAATLRVPEHFEVTATT